jgi:Spy/CpxP family protein refolding chaperone
MSFTKRTRVAALSIALSLCAASVPVVSADEAPKWPSEQEQQLKQADKQLLEVQRARFRALFGNDKEEAKRLDRQFKELQKERNQLLQATGRR